MPKNQLFSITMVIVIILFLTSAVFPTGKAYAASLNVTRFDDSIPGVVILEIVRCAKPSWLQTALSGVDTIDLPAGTYTLSITGNGENGNLTGDLDISEALTINGLDAGATITAAGGWDDRIIDLVAGSGTTNLFKLTISGGNIANDTGGGIRASGNF